MARISTASAGEKPQPTVPQVQRSPSLARFSATLRPTIDVAPYSGRFESLNTARSSSRPAGVTEFQSRFSKAGHKKRTQVFDCHVLTFESAEFGAEVSYGVLIGRADSGRKQRRRRRVDLELIHQLADGLFVRGISCHWLYHSLYIQPLYRLQEIDPHEFITLAFLKKIHWTCSVQGKRRSARTGAAKRP